MRFFLKKIVATPFPEGHASRRPAGVSWVLFLAVVCGSLPVHADHPINEFQLGIPFATSLEEARTRARDEQKIVMLLPAAYRSTTDNPVLSPATEAFRASALVDQRVVRLINRRFVPYYFEMEPRGSLYDKDAVDLTLLIKPELRFSSVMPTPPVVLMTPEGKSLGSSNLFCTADEFHATLLQILAENETYGRMTDDELLIRQSADRARVLHELGQPDDALKLLSEDQSSEAYYIRGVIARERGEWADMKKSFRMVTEKSRLPDITMQRIYRYWTLGNYEGIKALFDEIKSSHPRYQEAVYYAGLAHYYTGALPKALQMWEESILANPESAWSLRLDWTRGIAKHGINAPVMSHSRPESLLGRNYLSPHGNADLMRD